MLCNSFSAAPVPGRSASVATLVAPASPSHKAVSVAALQDVDISGHLAQLAIAQPLVSPSGARLRADTVDGAAAASRPRRRTRASTLAAAAQPSLSQFPAIPETSAFAMPWEGLTVITSNSLMAPFADYTMLEPLVLVDDAMEAFPDLPPASGDSTTTLMSSFLDMDHNVRNNSVAEAVILAGSFAYPSFPSPSIVPAVQSRSHRAATVMTRNRRSIAASQAPMCQVAPDQTLSAVAKHDSSVPRVVTRAVRPRARTISHTAPTPISCTYSTQRWDLSPIPCTPASPTPSTPISSSPSAYGRKRSRLELDRDIPAPCLRRRGAVCGPILPVEDVERMVRLVAEKKRRMSADDEDPEVSSPFSSPERSLLARTGTPA